MKIFKRIKLLYGKTAAEIRNRLQNHSLTKKISSYPLGKRFLNDMVFRTKLSLHFGLMFNLLYAVLQLVIGICYKSVWSGALAVYYALLAVMRFQLLKTSKKFTDDKDIISEWRKYHFCGVVLLLMTPIFASILILVVHKNSGAKYPGFMIYLMAVYTFCFIINAIRGLIKFKVCTRPVISAAKVINLTVALISVLSLETAVAARFGNEENFVFLKYVIDTTCGAICLIVLSMAVVMIIHGKKQLKIKGKKGDVNS